MPAPRTLSALCSRAHRPPLGPTLTVTVAAEACVLLPRHLDSTPGFLLMLVAALGWGLVASDPRLESHRASTVAAIGAVLVLAVAMPPRGSHDLYAYVMYGRTVGVYHTSPYVHPPSAFPHDPFLHLVGSGWRGTRSVYGPLFTALSVPLTKLAGASVLRARLLFQGLELVVVACALAIVWTQTRSMRAVAFLGLHPAVVVSLVNGGHNDAFVGLAVLGAALLLARGHATSAGVVAALGLLVKASAAFGILGLAVWVLVRNRRELARFATASTGTTVLGYAFTGTAALRSVAGGASRTSRASLWSIVSAVDPHVVGTAATITVVSLALVGAFRFRNVRLPWLPIGLAFAAYLFAGAYVLPWYAVWVLPALALARRSTVAAIVGAHAALLAALYELSRHVDGDTLAGTARGIAVVSGAVLVVGILIAWLVRPRFGDRYGTEWESESVTPMGPA